MCYGKPSQKSIQNPVKHLRSIFHKKFYLTCLKGSSYASESLKYIFKNRSGITVKYQHSLYNTRHKLFQIPASGPLPIYKHFRVWKNEYYSWQRTSAVLNY